MLLVSGGDVRNVIQFLSANYISYSLTDVLSSLGSLLRHAAVSPILETAKPNPTYAVRDMPVVGTRPTDRSDGNCAGRLDAVDRRHGIVVIVWTTLESIFKIGDL